MVRAWKMMRAARGREPVGSCHHAIFQSTDQLFDGRLRRTTATASHHEAIAHPAVPAPDPTEAFAWTAERAIQPGAVGVPVRQITADCGSPSCPSPGSRGGTARCRRSLTTTYYRRDMEESLDGFCRGQRPPFR